VPLLATVPLDSALREAGDAGQPVVEAEPGSDAAQAIIGLADALAAVRPGTIRKPLALLS